MADLIDREALKLELCKLVAVSLDEKRSYASGVICALGHVATAPAVEQETEPVRHGRWVQCKGKCDQWHCSECNRTIKYNPRPRRYQNTKNKLPVQEYNRYCPYCGAKMDGGEKGD